jgi:hypothetical protein
MKTLQFSDIEDTATELLSWYPQPKDLGSNGKLIEKCKYLQNQMQDLLEILDEYRHDGKNKDKANRISVDLIQRKNKLAYVSDVIIRNRVS